MTRKYLQTILEILLWPLCVFSFHAVAIGFFDVYVYWHDFDILMHFLGGASIAYGFHLTYVELSRQKILTIRSRIIVAIGIVFGTIAVAVLWEFYEFLLDHFLHTRIQVDNFDTMKDLFMGTLGSVCVVFWTMVKTK